MYRMVKKVKGKKSHPMPLDREHGFINSSHLSQSPEYLFDFCTDEESLSKVVAKLPSDVKNLFDLMLLSARKTTQDQYEIQWRNRPDAKIKTTLSLLLKKAPVEQGTILSAEAVFEQLNEKGSFDLLNLFLDNMKAMLTIPEQDRSIQ